MKIDYTKLAVLLLPTFLRQPLMIALLRTLMHPIQEIHDRHHTARDKRLYDLEHTSQICYIKDALNKEFQITDYSAGFEIEDINAKGNWLTAYDEIGDFKDRHTIVEDESYLILWDEEIIKKPTVSFTVIIPISVEWNDYNKARINSIVNKYRLASRTFNTSY